MKTIDPVASASENLLETYFALGSAAPCSTLSRQPAFRLCLSQANHPISNFAADLRLDANAAAQLAKLAAARPSFHVYRLPGDQPKHSGELLIQAGFRVGHSLTQMVWDPSSESILLPRAIELLTAQNLRERERVAGFMTEQFFAKQPHAFRRQVVDGTVRAKNLELVAHEDRGRILAAVMLCNLADTIGIYNLCVSAGLRGRGLGQDMLGCLKHEALSQRKLLVLQCESALVSWYRKQGFCSIGFVEVYSFAAGNGLDIM